MGDEKYKAKIDPDLCLKHYSQPHVLDAILSISRGKETVGSFGGTGYGSRPDLIQYQNDIIEQVKKGVTSFHFSEETWQNPMGLMPGMSQKELDPMRTGWDLIIDIDCNYWEYSKIAADLLIQVLEHAGVSCVSCKFSGNHGFHIAIPYEAFPPVMNGKATAELFPEAPHVIAEYLKEQIVPSTNLSDNLTYNRSLSGQILEQERKSKSETDEEVVAHISEKVELPFDKLIMKEQVGDNEVVRFNAFHILEIDTLLISSRHLIRHVYSINEKSGWISIPINPNKVMQFDRKLAKIENFVKSKYKFLDRNSATPGEALKLFQLSYDFNDQKKKNPVIIEDKKKKKREFEEITVAIPKEFFPPPIKKILSGLSDGKKRAVFILKNFLHSLGWGYNEIEDCILEWNEKNPEPLREVLIKGQLKNLRNQRKPILPPNYSNKAYYEGIGVDVSEPLAKGIKNPVNDTLRRYYAVHGRPGQHKGGREKLTEEQKEARRVYRRKKRDEKKEK